MTTPSLAASAAPDAAAMRARLAAIAALVALGDYLLFGHARGVSVALFAGAVEFAAVLSAGSPARRAGACALVAVATLAPVVEDFSLLSAAIAISGMAAVVLIANDGWRGGLDQRALQALRFLAAGPLRVLFDAPRAAVALMGGLRVRTLVGWALPLGLGGVFLALFAVANPVVEGWLTALDPGALLDLLDFRRLAFWLLLLIGVWPFVLFAPPRLAERPRREIAPAPRAEDGLLSALLCEAAILRSLVLFNAMFAVETVLDAEILGRGHALPSGVSFAAYAHRGAYPLVATALLAAAFVVAAMRPGSAACRSQPIRVLVYLWIAQNVALVVSSLYRLALYVEVYSLTYWRVAAFVWMGLVALGLALIVAQLIGGRSIRWLMSANGVAAAAALYLCAFVDFNAVIADFNLRHCREVAADSAALDMDYLRSLGPDALPAIDAALAASFPSARLASLRSTLAQEHDARSRDWRGWTWRNYRLSRKLSAEDAP